MIEVLLCGLVIVGLFVILSSIDTNEHVHEVALCFVDGFNALSAVIIAIAYTPAFAFGKQSSGVSSLWAMTFEEIRALKDERKQSMREFRERRRKELAE